MRTLINTPGQLTQAVIVPNTPVEMLSPFQLNESGLVSFTTDPLRRAYLHILAVALTAPGERVMRPTYGAGLFGLVFQPGSAGLLQTTLQRLQQGLAAGDPETSYNIIDVQFVPSQDAPSTYYFSVSFTINRDPTLHTALFDFNGKFVGTT